MPMFLPQMTVCLYVCGQSVVGVFVAVLKQPSTVLLFPLVGDEKFISILGDRHLNLKFSMKSLQKKHSK